MPTLIKALKNQPVALAFGTSGLRGLVADMTDLECYINTQGFLKFLQKHHGLKKGDKVYVAGDLRHSTPRILLAVHKAIEDYGCQTVYCGLVPTPTLVFYAMQHSGASIMVTGSHIPDDRNGLKFQRADGEVLKDDEAPINEQVALIRKKLYSQDSAKSIFNQIGMFKKPPATLPAEETGAADLYLKRHTDVFNPNTFTGKKIVFYQHSSAGREILPELLERLGANVVRVGWSDKFVPIDSENITAEQLAYFAKILGEHPDAFALMSADGDADRPILIDETGTFHRGDVLGAVVADWLDADHAALPISSSDAAASHLSAKDIPYEHTKIGSPYVIASMLSAVQSGKQRVVSWEVNGGFLIASDLTINDKLLKALPTRDAILPMIIATLAASSASQKVSQTFTVLPRRFTQAGLIDNFPIGTYKAMVEYFATNTPAAHRKLGEFFSPALGFGNVAEINNLDGIRIYFDNNDIAHMRQSSNAPQLRIYSTANSQARANQITEHALADPDGIFRRMQRAFES